MATKPKAASAYTDAEVEEILATYGKFISVPQAAEVLAVSQRTVKRIIAAGRLPMFAVGCTRTHRVKTADVIALMQQVA